MNADLIFYAKETVNDVLRQAHRVWTNHVFLTPNIDFALRGRCAGRAYYRLNTIKLNGQLFAENVDAFISRTIPHEVAHLITRIVYPKAKRSHGKEWQSVMRALGVKGITRCHSYTTTPARKVRRDYAYACDCRTHYVSAIRHNRLSRVPGCYSCSYCRDALRPATSS